MTRWTILFVLAVLMVALNAEEEPQAEAKTEVKEEEKTQDSKVLVLTKQNFQETVNNTEFILVEFYAPWCGHCKSLAPQYEAAAKTLAESDSPIKLAKVDATEESELASEFNVNGYPTIIFFKNGDSIQYTGGRTADEIVAWVNKKSGPPTVELNNIEAAKQFISVEDVVMIGFLASDKRETYTAVAENIDSIKFGVVSSENVANELGAKMGTIVMYRPYEGEEKTVTLTGDSSKEEIVAFINTNELGLVTTYSDKTVHKIFASEIKSHLLSLFSDEDNAKEIKANLRDVAREFKGKVLVVHIDTATSDAERIMEFIGVDKKDLPCVRLVLLKDKMIRYKPEFDGIIKDKLQSFLQDYIEGNLKPNLNTEEVPEDWDSKPVKILVGKNFNDVARDKSKFVFVEFYAPWCGHCKDLAPIWDELGEHFKNNEEVVIAKMDSTKNELEDIPIGGFPTLKFFPKDSDKVLDYRGERKLAPMIEYVEKHINGTAPIEDEETEPESEEQAAEGEGEDDDTHDEL